MRRPSSDSALRRPGRRREKGRAAGGLLIAVLLLAAASSAGEVPGYERIEVRAGAPSVFGTCDLGGARLLLSCAADGGLAGDLEIDGAHYAMHGRLRRHGLRLSAVEGRGPRLAARWQEGRLRGRFHRPPSPGAAADGAFDVPAAGGSPPLVTVLSRLTRGADGRIAGRMAFSCGSGPVLWANVSGGDGVALPARAVEVACGKDHALALTEDGDVYAWGRNHEGQLGDGTRVDSPWPKRVAGLPPAIAIAAGGAHSLAVVRP